MDTVLPVQRSDSTKEKRILSTDTFILRTFLDDLPILPLAQQQKRLSELTEHFSKYEVSQQQLVGCWEKIKPFINSPLQPYALEFISQCLTYHFDECDILRLDFYKVITINSHTGIQLLKALTKDGRDLRHFEHQIGNLLSQWLEHSTESLPTKELLKFITKIIKFSFVYMNEDSIKKMIVSANLISNEQQYTLLCLEFLSALCQYGYIPQPSIGVFTRQICAAVVVNNVEASVDQKVVHTESTQISMESLSKPQPSLPVDPRCETLAWGIFGNMLGSHISGLTINTLISILYTTEIEYIKGAIVILDHVYTTNNFGSTMLLKSLEKTCDLKQESVTLLVLKTVLKIGINETVEWDFFVAIFGKSKWIYDNVDQVLSQTDYKTPVKIHDYYQNILFCLMFNFTKLSFHARYVLLTTLCDLIPFVDEKLMMAIIDYSNPVYYDSDLIYFEYYSKLLQLTFKRNWIEPRIIIQTKIQDPELFKLLIRQLENPVPIKILENFYRIDIEKVDVMIFVEYVLRIVCDIRVKNGYAMNTFWNFHKKIKNTPKPRDYLEQTLIFDHESRLLSLEFLFQIFNTLYNTDRHQSGLVYQKLLNVFSWNSFVDSSLRVKFLKFQLEMNQSTLIGLKTENCLDSLIFACVANIQYDSSIAVVMETLETLLIILKDFEIFIDSPVALRILAETCISLITQENKTSHIQFPTGFRKHDLYLKLYQVCFVLIQFKQIFPKSIHDGFISALMFGLGRWPAIAKYCIQGLSLSFYELPYSIIRYLPALIMKISQVTSSNLAQANLELLASLASLPELHTNLTNTDYKRVFGIALAYLREQKNNQILTLAYYTTQIWFLSLKISERKNYVGMITNTLLANTQETLDENVELV
jgi:hypothetical protein